MARTPPAPNNTRNGLKWRDGRPRWEPSPASRAAGLKGLDLKDLEGRWLAERGVAIAVCDSRQTLAALIRETAAGAQDAAADLRALLEALPALQEPAQRLRRLLVQDLIDAGQALLAGQDLAAGVQLVRAPRTAERLVDAYFAAVDRGDVVIKPATRKAYSAHKAKFLERFAGRGVAGIAKLELKAWYRDLQAAESLASANMRLRTASVFLAYAEDLGWTGPSIAVRMKLQKPQGRRVFWTLAEERAFTAWLDANGYPDLADAIVFGLWTGARPVDLCAADLEDLAGDVWHFVPVKTEKSGHDAMPGLLPVVKARLERRRAAAAHDTVRGLNRTPFLWDPREQRRYTPDELYRRYRHARSLYLAQDGAIATLAEKRLQDMRDTCLTRLQEAGVALSRMWTWTGHSQESVEEVLRDHYIALRAEGQREMADQLEAWAAKEELALS